LWTPNRRFDNAKRNVTAIKKAFSMSLEHWNTVLQFASAVLLGMTFAVGAGAIFTGYLIGKRQDERICDD
jgi:hypothetical protein